MAILTLNRKAASNLLEGQDIPAYRVVGATDADIVADVLPSSDLAFTVVANPTFPARLLFTVTNGGAAITSLDVTIVGFDEDGAAVSESLSLDNGGAGGTHEVASVAFMTRVTSLTLGTLTGGDGAARVKAGTALLAATDYDTPAFGQWQTPAQELASGDFVRVPAGMHSVHVAVSADQASDASGVVIEQSMLGVAVDKTLILTDETGSRTMGISTPIDRWVPITMPFWRFRFQCGTTGQAQFDVDVSMSGRVVKLYQPLTVSATSGAGANQTVTVPTSDYVRHVKRVTIVYSAPASVTVTLTLNSGRGAAFDTLLLNIVLAAATDATASYGDEVLELAPDDVLDVLAPLLAAETSSVVIYSTEVEGH